MTVQSFRHLSESEDGLFNPCVCMHDRPGNARSCRDHSGVLAEPWNANYSGTSLTSKQRPLCDTVIEMARSALVAHLVAEGNGVQEGHVGSECCHISRLDNRAGSHLCMAESGNLPHS